MKFRLLSGIHVEEGRPKPYKAVRGKLGPVIETDRDLCDMFGNTKFERLDGPSSAHRDRVQDQDSAVMDSGTDDPKKGGKEKPAPVEPEAPPEPERPEGQPTDYPDSEEFTEHFDAATDAKARVWKISSKAFVVTSLDGKKILSDGEVTKTGVKDTLKALEAEFAV
jgi:hypothetical protein